MANSLIMSTLAIILTAFTSTCLARHMLLNWQKLQEGQSLEAGSYKFIMQTDCNLILYEPAGPVWASNTGYRGERGCKAVMESNGNFVIYDGKGNTVWSSNSKSRKGHYALVLQEDRNVVIYGPDVWSAGTYIRHAGVSAMNGTVDTGFGREIVTAVGGAGNYIKNILLNWGELRAGQSLEAGSYKFIMQENCNLVLYEPAGPVWSSNTGHVVQHGCRAVLENNGNLVVYDRKDNTVWSSNSKSGKGHYVLVLQEDRNIVIYGPDVWSTHTYLIRAVMNGTADAEFARDNLTAVGRLGAVGEEAAAAA